MGVQGFTAYLERVLAGRLPEERPLPIGGPCFVDGSGLVFAIAKWLGKDLQSERGGNYGLGRVMAEDFVNSLGLNDPKMSIFVIADGPEVHESKLKERNKRKSRRSEQYYKLYRYLEFGEAPRSPEDLPLPPLWVEEVYGGLATCAPTCPQLTLLRVREEADAYLAQVCAAQNILLRAQGAQPWEASFILAQDSDFFFTADTVYVPLDSIHDGLCRTYTREEIAKALGIPADRMSDLAIAIGNDYYEGWKVPDLAPNASSMDRIAAIVKHFREGTAPNFRDMDSLSKGARYSLKFYDNESRDYLLEMQSPAYLAAADYRFTFRRNYLTPIRKSPTRFTPPGEEGFTIKQIEEILLAIRGRVQLLVARHRRGDPTREDPESFVLSSLRTIWGQLQRLNLIKVGQPTANSWSQYCAAYAYLQALRGVINIYSPLRNSDVGFANLYLSHSMYYNTKWFFPATDWEASHKDPMDVIVQAQVKSNKFCLDKFLHPLFVEGASGFHENYWKKNLSHLSKGFSTDVPETQKVSNRKPAKRNTRRRKAKQKNAAKSASSGTSQAQSHNTIEKDLSVVSNLTAPIPTAAAPDEGLKDSSERSAVVPEKTSLNNPLPEFHQLNISGDRRPEIAGLPDTDEFDPDEVIVAQPRQSYANGDVSSYDSNTASASFMYAQPSYPDMISKREVLSQSYHQVGNHVDFNPAFEFSEPNDVATNLMNKSPTETVVKEEVLPIDSHRDKIIQHVQSHRVTIIHGETGSGKSSCLPRFLWEANSGRPFRAMISQPRRIAARSLATRVESQLINGKGQVGLRLGGGVKEGDSRAPITFCTTGYLVRLLAGAPSYFDSVTHLILDEVHERSVDQDVLVLLAKRLLESNKKIKLVLMSATLQAKLFQNYFSCSPPLFVGAKRYPLTEFFLDDPMLLAIAGPIMERSVQGLMNMQQKALDLCPDLPSDMTDGEKHEFLAKNPHLKVEVKSDMVKQQLGVAVQLAMAIGKEARSAILIFVSGIAEITEIMAQFEEINEVILFQPSLIDSVYGGIREFRVIPIHSTIPFEEQLDAWKETEPNVLKVIVATNAAESSITLPDVDNVICFGTRRELEYNTRSNASSLVARWVSKASATQRAGRTARTRPGRVWRLYTRAMYNSMLEFDLPEIHSCPLDKVLLDLKSMVSGAVIPILLNVIDPPSLERAEIAMKQLYDQGFLNHFDDDVALHTPLGIFVSRLGLDLSVGTLIARAIIMDCLPEGVALAAVLSLDRSPFRVATPLVHKDPNEYHGILMGSLPTKIALDGGLYSETLALVRLLSIWSHSSESKFRAGFCMVGSIVPSRMSRLVVLHRHLMITVAQALNMDSHTDLMLPRPEDIFRDSVRLNRIRFVLFSSNCGNLLQYKPRKNVPCYEDCLGANIEEPEGRYARLTIAKEIGLTKQEIATAFPQEVQWAFYENHLVTVSAASVKGTSSLDQKETLFNFARHLLASPFANYKNTSESAKNSQQSKKAKSSDTTNTKIHAHPGVWSVLLDIHSTRSNKQRKEGSQFQDYGQEGMADFYDSDLDYDSEESYGSSIADSDPLVDYLFVPSDENLLRSLREHLELEDFDGAERVSLNGQEVLCISILSIQVESVQKWQRETNRSYAKFSLNLHIEYNTDGSETCHSSVDIFCHNFKLTENMTLCGLAGKPIYWDRIKLAQSGGSGHVWTLLTIHQTQDASSLYVRNEQYDYEDSEGGVRDAPLGIRLLIAYASRNRPRTAVKLRDLTAKGSNGDWRNGQDSYKTLLLPEQLSPIFEPLRYAVPEGLGPEASEEANIFVKYPTVKRILAPWHTLTSCMLPLSGNVIPGFAVGVNLLGEKGVHLASAGQIDLIPQGLEWIHYALICVGKDRNSFGSQRKLNSLKITYCENIRKLLWEVATHPDSKLERNDDIISGFDSVFGKFTEVARPLPTDYYMQRTEKNSTVNVNEAASTSADTLKESVVNPYAVPASSKSAPSTPKPQSAFAASRRTRSNKKKNSARK